MDRAMLRKSLWSLFFILVFLLGWFSSNVVSDSSIQMPLGNDLREKDSPCDWIKNDQIHVFNDKVVIDIEGAEWAEFENTNSMDPVIDTGANSIELKPTEPNTLKPGDIISYKSRFVSEIIIHRIVSIGVDDFGWFAITKGDNNPGNDPGKVRFEDVQGVVVGILY